MIYETFKEFCRNFDKIKKERDLENQERQNNFQDIEKKEIQRTMREKLQERIKAYSSN